MRHPRDVQRAAASPGALLGLFLASIAATDGARSTVAGQSSVASKVNFSIGNKSLADALRRVAEVGNFDLMFPTASLDESRRYSLYGRYTPLEALSKLLNGTGLEYVYDGGHNVAIRPRGEAIPVMAGHAA